MRVHFRRQLAPACLVVSSLAILGSPGAVSASALQRLATSLDLSHLAASGTAGQGAAAMVDEMAVAIPARTVLPANVDLRGASTEVRIGLPYEADMDIEVTNEAGAVVCVARVHMPAGWQKVGFSGRGHDGAPLPNGVYFYRVAVGDDVMVTRVVIER